MKLLIVQAALREWLSAPAATALIQRLGVRHVQADVVGIVGLVDAGDRGDGEARAQIGCLRKQPAADDLIRTAFQL